MIQQSSGEPPGPFAIDLDADAIFGACAPADAFAAVLMEARVVLADIASPLHAELWGSDILAALGGCAAAADLVPVAEAAGTPAALALLRALSAVGSPGLRADADAAAARLAAHGRRAQLGRSQRAPQLSASAGITVTSAARRKS
jgi:hypothetical protein